MEGKVMDAAETNAIAKLPNREGMLSMFAGALTSTLSGLAVAMQAYADKQEEPAA
jgi:large subunit ribosomal protein L10